MGGLPFLTLYSQVITQKVDFFDPCLPTADTLNSSPSKNKYTLTPFLLQFFSWWQQQTLGTYDFYLFI
jgi:hypothetical protein